MVLTAYRQNAFINEILRLAYGITARLPRVAPTETLQYKEYAIPPGVSDELPNKPPLPLLLHYSNLRIPSKTPVSTSTYFVHGNASIFPEPDTFRPERWIEAAERGDNLKRYLVPFNRGTRGCIGIKYAH